MYTSTLLNQISSNTSNPKILEYIQYIYQQQNHIKLHFTDIDNGFRRKLREMSDIFSLVSDSYGGASGFYFNQKLMEFTFPSSQKFSQRFKRCPCNCSISNVFILADAVYVLIEPPFKVFANKSEHPRFVDTYASPET